MLGESVVIAGDGSGTDVGLATEIGVAEVRQMIRLGAGGERCILGLDEVADGDIVGQLRPRPQMRERTDQATRIVLAGDFDVANQLYFGEVSRTKGSDS